MSSVNKVTLLGNLARDPESRDTQSGKIVNLTVVTNEQWNDKQSGERKERAEFHKVVIFNDRLADVAERFLRKGRKVYVEGQLQTRKYTDQSGQERYSTEVVLSKFRGELVLVDSNRSGDDEENDTPHRTAPARLNRAADAVDRRTGGGPRWEKPKSDRDLDDEIPF